MKRIGRPIFLVCFLLLFAFTAFRYSVEQLPTYAPPLRGPLLLTGTFGELRSNHFHGGIDLRGATGTTVYSIGSGYVSRVVVDNGGFGQAVYVEHPEGYTSVYGHLHRFSDSLLAMVRREQYAQQRFELDLELAPGDFPVARGAKIGEVGNRGFSFGPHLHFEIRHTSSGDFINPLHFGYPVADTRPPDLGRMRVYTLDSRGNEQSGQTIDLRRVASGQYQLAADTLFVEAPHIGFGVGAFDRQDALYNRNGIYGGSLRSDTSLLFEFELASVPGQERRYLNAHADYREQRARGRWYHRLFTLPGNQLPIYEQAGGRLSLAPGETRSVRIELWDYAGNTSVAAFYLKRQPTEAEPPTPSEGYNYFLPFDEASIIDDGSCRLRFPEGALYEDCYFRYQRQTDRSEDVYSDVFQLHDPLTPVHRPIDIALRPRLLLPANLRSKAVIAQCPPYGRPTNFGGAWDREDRLGATINRFGDYCILIDTIPPTITPRFRRSDFRRRSSIRFRITDNFATSGNAQQLITNAWLDGEWLLFEYDLKSGTIFHTFDGTIARGVHDLRVEVTDDRGNMGSWTGQIRR